MMDDKKKKPMQDSHDGEDVHMKAKMDVLHALRQMAQEMMADEVGEGDEGGEEPSDAGAVVAHVDIKKMQPSETPHGEGKISRLDDMTQEDNESGAVNHEALSGDEDEDKELMDALQKHMGKGGY